MKITRKSFFILGLATLFGFSALGIAVIHYFHEVPVSRVFTYGDAWWYQVLRGFLFGGIAALNLLWLIQSKVLEEARLFFTKLINEADLKLPDLLFLSLAAGIGEEIFFRGALQPHIGIWPTAILFVALHGYLNPFNLRMSIYGLLMVVVSAGLGYLFEFVGIYAAMTAHFVIDAVLFIRFKYYPGKEDLEKAEEMDMDA